MVKDPTNVCDRCRPQVVEATHDAWAEPGTEWYKKNRPFHLKLCDPCAKDSPPDGYHIRPIRLYGAW